MFSQYHVTEVHIMRRNVTRCVSPLFEKFEALSSASRRDERAVGCATRLNLDECNAHESSLPTDPKSRGVVVCQSFDAGSLKPDHRL